MIVIIGSDDDFHSKFVKEELKKRNVPVKYLDSRNYPIINWSPTSSDSYLVLEDEKVFVEDIKGVYWRWYYGVVFDTKQIIWQEKTSALESFLYSVGDISFNSLQAVELHCKKGAQTQILHKNGIRLPRTLITSDKDAVEEFYLKNDKSLIYKPVRGGAFTKKFKDEDLERVDTLINCPCQLQEFIHGVDIRVYAFETGEIYAGEIIAQNVDFREDPNAVINKVCLPKKVQKDCLKVLKLLGLKYSGIDIRLNQKGEYVFIEANPAPMFIHYERMTGYPITDTLIKNLTK